LKDYSLASMIPKEIKKKQKQKQKQKTKMDFF
jgi:hypothetical protein